MNSFLDRQGNSFYIVFSNIQKGKTEFICSQAKKFEIKGIPPNNHGIEPIVLIDKGKLISQTYISIYTIPNTLIEKMLGNFIL